MLRRFLVSLLTVLLMFFSSWGIGNVPPRLDNLTTVPVQSETIITKAPSNTSFNSEVKSSDAPTLSINTAAQYTPIPWGQFLNKPTQGISMPVLCNAYISDCNASVQILGTVNNNRGRWNPFLPENDMEFDGQVYSKEFTLNTTGGRHHDGVYALRFVNNHSLLELVKADLLEVDATGKPALVRGDRANQAQNVMIRVDHEDTYRVTFDPETLNFDITPPPIYLTQIESMQVNGFVWDDEDEFQKFDELRDRHNMRPVADGWWEITLPLKKDGGLQRRADGVYQFLFSANHNEDWGFAGYNDSKGRLVGGAGFGSSGGQSLDSGITIQVFEDSDYTLRVHPERYRFEVLSPEGIAPVQLLNQNITSVQLLGTVYTDKPFDPTVGDRPMDAIGEHLWQKVLSLEPGIYGINFGLNQELFLDTMALGAWLQSDRPEQLIARAWHGKPNEPNVFFKVLVAGDYQFTYDTITDEFSIESLNHSPLNPEIPIDTLQLVGSFDPPLEAWNPVSSANNMERVSPSVFEKSIALKAGKVYDYKFTANNWGWDWVFADYELDGYGRDYLGRNPDPLDSRLEDLTLFGQLTTHGDPHSLQVNPERDACYSITANLETGAYAVHPSDKQVCE